MDLPLLGSGQGMTMPTLERYFWSGFSDELAKIAAPSIPKSLQSPKPTSKPVIREPDQVGSTVDPLEHTRTIQPPPVTAGGM